MNKPCLCLTGFMGVGKSTAGKRAASLLGVPFLDTDREIENQTSMTIAEFFQKKGEKEFRKIEEKLAFEISGLSGWIIATGGGFLLNPVIQNLFSHHIILALMAKKETLRHRFALFAYKQPVRPLLSQNWHSLYEERKKVYTTFPHILWVDGLTKEELAQKVVDVWKKNIE